MWCPYYPNSITTRQARKRINRVLGIPRVSLSQGIAVRRPKAILWFMLIEKHVWILTQCRACHRSDMKNEGYEFSGVAAKILRWSDGTASSINIYDIEIHPANEQGERPSQERPRGDMKAHAIKRLEHRFIENNGVRSGSI
jgi:hypothetical protein